MLLITMQVQSPKWRKTLRILKKSDRLPKPSCECGTAVGASGSSAGGLCAICRPSTTARPTAGKEIDALVRHEKGRANFDCPEDPNSGKITDQGLPEIFGLSRLQPAYLVFETDA
jgi:hypothetical protein